MTADLAVQFRRWADHAQALLLGDREPTTAEQFLSEEYQRGRRDAFNACAEWLEIDSPPSAAVLGAREWREEA